MPLDFHVTIPTNLKCLTPLSIDSNLNLPKGASVWFVLFATGVTAIGGFLFGYDTAVINGANSFLKVHMNLNPSQEGLAGASAILGCLPGAMFAGYLSDWFGRKTMLYACAILYAISGLLSALSFTFDEFVVSRIISGLGIGASSMICPVYIAEIAPEKWRGRLGTLFQLGIVTGIFITLFVNRYIQGMGDPAWNVDMGWRWMLGMEVVPAIIFIGLLFAVPESPRWLAQVGRLEEARHILTQVDGADHAETELLAIREASLSENGNLSDLFAGSYLRPLIIAVLLMAFSQFCGINAIMYYSTKIFAAAGGDTNSAFTASVWIGLVNLLSTFVAIGFVDESGRRLLLLIGTALQSVALIVVGWMFNVGENGLPLLLCIVLFIAAFAMAMGPISWLFCSEIFPGKVRGLAMSIAAFTVWISCYFVAQTFPMMNDNPAIGPAKTFWIYAGISTISFLFVLFYLPETKGRTLEQIEKMWSHPK